MNPENPQPTETPPAVTATPPAPLSPASATNSQPVTGDLSATPPTTKPPVSKKKRLIIGLAALLVLLIGGGAAAYMGIVLPNQPERLWPKALQNTVKGYDGLVAYSQKNQNVKGATMEGSYKVTTSGVVADGTINLKAYDKDADLKFDVGASGQRINVEALLHTPDNATSPDIYVKATGLGGLGKLLGAGDAELGSTFSSLDGQWYVIDHTLLDQAQQTLTQDKSAGSPAGLNMSMADVQKIEQSVGQANRQYLFTDTSDKAVFTVTTNVGKEKLDDRSVYHYKVGYNKDHLKAYVTALQSSLKQTKLSPYFTDDQLKQTQSDIDKLDGKGTADVWVDMGTKLVRKVRFTDHSQTDTYTDISLNYNGGSSYPFVIAFHNGGETKNDTTANLTLDTKANTFTADLKSTSGNNSGTVHLVIKPSNEKVPFTKPANAKSLADLLSGFLGGGLGGVSPTSSGGFDNSLLNLN